MYFYAYLLCSTFQFHASHTPCVEHKNIHLSLKYSQKTTDLILANMLCYGKTSLIGAPKEYLLSYQPINNVYSKNNECWSNSRDSFILHCNTAALPTHWSFSTAPQHNVLHLKLKLIHLPAVPQYSSWCRNDNSSTATHCIYSMNKSFKIYSYILRFVKTK